MAVKLPDLQRSVPIVEDDKTPSMPFHIWWRDFKSILEKALNDLADAIATITGISGDITTIFASKQDHDSALDILSGTGDSAANGELLIGNGTGYTKNTLTAGANISIANTAGHITIASTGGGGSVGSGQFAIDDGTASASGVFTFNDGAA